MMYLAAALMATSPAAGPLPAVIPPAVSLAEARHALAAGRVEQARTMIATAVASGASGDPVDLLLAEAAFVRRDDAQALALTVALAQRHPGNVFLAERAGIAALRLGKVSQAAAFLHRATTLPSAGWRAWNALGAAADLSSDWPTADAAYARALALAPNRAEVANNRGWSLLLRGRWHEAEAELARAWALDPTLPRLTNNLMLARDALAAELPARVAGEGSDAWAARLNDAGVAAAVQGKRSRAIAAFAQAIEARPAYDRRAAANLAAIEVHQ